MDFKITFADTLTFEIFNGAVYLEALKIVFFLDFLDFCFFFYENICRFL